MMKPLKPLLLLLMLTALMSCQKKIASTENAGTQKEEVNKAKDWTEGVLRDYTGTDGCNWVIETSDGKYEPLNLNDFDINLQDGQKLKFNFVVADGASICMVGKRIRIVEIN